MRILLIPAVLALSACGFTPLHQGVAAVGGDSPLRSISIDTRTGDDADDKRAAYDLQQALRDRLGAPEAASKYALTLTPQVRRAGLGAGANDIASRFDINLTVRYSLRLAATGDALDSGRVYAVSTFGAPLDPYGGIRAEEAAVSQATTQAADKIVSELALYFSDPTPAP